MFRYIVKRVLLIIPILFAVAFIVYAILALTPGDPGRILLGMSATQEAVDQLNEQLGATGPFLVRFYNYIYNIMTKFDFGLSYRTQMPVFDEIAIRFPVSLTLASLGLIFQTILGVSAGVFSAVKQYSKADVTLTIVAMLIASVPVFWLGLMLILVFSVKLGLLPSNGVGTWRHYVLPLVGVTLPGAAHVLKLTRSAMLETIRQDYVRTARAKGAGEAVVIWGHAFKNAMLPIITSLSMNFSFLLGGTVLTESVFSIPGLGSGVVTAIRNKDIPQVLAIVLLIAAFFCILMLLVDIAYSIADPRIKARFARSRKGGGF